MMNRDMNFHEEIEFLRSVIDLAMARRPPSSGNKKDLGEYLAFDLIIDSYKELSRQLKVDHLLKERCYKILLLMSADHQLTWWDKVRNVSFYVKQLESQKSRRSPSPYSIKARTSEEKSVPDSSVMRLRERSVSPSLYQQSGRTSKTAPSILEEGAELSFILNNRPGNEYSQVLAPPPKPYQSAPVQPAHARTETYFPPPAPIHSPSPSIALSPVVKKDNTFAETLKLNSPEFSVAGKNFPFLLFVLSHILDFRFAHGTNR
jgi:hypothetical protein